MRVEASCKYYKEWGKCGHANAEALSGLILEASETGETEGLIELTRELPGGSNWSCIIGIISDIGWGYQVGEMQSKPMCVVGGDCDRCDMGVEKS